jgi:hypothetical protein
VRSSACNPASTTTRQPNAVANQDSRGWSSVRMMMAFVEYFTPDATIDLVGDARIELADADVLGQFLVAFDARRDRFQTRERPASA